MSGLHKPSNWKKMTREERLLFYRSHDGASRSAQYWWSQYDSDSPLPTSLLSDEEEAILLPLIEKHEAQARLRTQRLEEERIQQEEVRHYTAIHGGKRLVKLRDLLDQSPSLPSHLVSVVKELFSAKEARQEQIAALKEAGTWDHPSYKTLKQAYADGWKHLSPGEFEPEGELFLKGHHLFRGAKRAKSMTEWKKDGYRIKSGEKPHEIIQGTYGTYGVYRDDQVEAIVKRAKTGLSQVSVLDVELSPILAEINAVLVQLL